MLKVEMNGQPKKQEKITEYPCLGQSMYCDLVVLFYAENSGVVVVPYGRWRLGAHNATWHTNMFTQFNGELTISNG